MSVTKSRQQRIERQPWHYDATKGKPDWAVEMARQRVKERQQENDAKGATRRQGERA